MPNLIHIAERLFNTPLLIHPAKADIIMHVLQSRLGLDLNGEVDAELIGGGGIEANRLIGTVLRSDRPAGLTPIYKGTAVISVVGSLVNRGAWIGAKSGMTSYEGIAAQLQDAVADKEVHTILLDIDSPGGEAGGMFNLAAQVRAARDIKPVIAVVSDMAASAAYGIAANASEIVASPTSVVGSIGVVMLHLDRSGELAAKGIKPTMIFAGAHKVDGNPLGPLSDAVKADLQGRVFRMYDQFLNIVGEGRGSRLDARAAQATEARTFIGEEAVAVGLADRIGAFETVLNELASSPRLGRTSQRRSSMTTETTFTQAQLDAAVATAVASATKAGADAERARIAAIVNDPAAKGREPQALSLALNADISAAAAIKVLGTFPVAATQPTIPERAAGLPQLGGDILPAQSKQQAAQTWGDLAATINSERGFRN